MAGCGGEVGVNWLEGGARVQVRGQHIQKPPMEKQGTRWYRQGWGDCRGL